MSVFSSAFSGLGSAILSHTYNYRKAHANESMRLRAGEARWMESLLIQVEECVSFL